MIFRISEFRFSELAEAQVGVVFGLVQCGVWVLTDLRNSLLGWGLHPPLPHQIFKRVFGIRFKSIG